MSAGITSDRLPSRRAFGALLAACACMLVPRPSSAQTRMVAEEVVVVAYLLVRLRQLGLPDGRALACSALLRGTYHLYQGIGGGLGNIVMGLVFGRFYQRTNRLWPLVVAHALIDVVAFVGFLLIGDRLGLAAVQR